MGRKRKERSGTIWLEKRGYVQSREIARANKSKNCQPRPAGIMALKRPLLLFAKTLNIVSTRYYCELETCFCTMGCVFVIHWENTYSKARIKTIEQTLGVDKNITRFPSVFHM